MRLLVIVLCGLATALAVPEGYHYDAPAVTSTLYFPNLPEDDCEPAAPQPEVTYQKELPSYVQHTQHVYTAPVKQQVQIVQPLKTQVTYEKEQVQNVWGSSGQQSQSTVWGSLKKIEPAPQKTVQLNLWDSSKQQQDNSQSTVWGSSGQQSQSTAWGSSLGSLQKVEPVPQKAVQLNLWDTSKQQQSSSWGTQSSSNVWNSASQQQEQSSVWVKPQRQVEEVYKHVYVQVPPEDKEEYQPPQIIQPVVHKQKHYKIIFIKAPSPPAPKSVVVPPQPQNEEKTIVYVLHQKPEHKQEVIVQKQEPAKQNKPEVFFIKYKNQKEQVKQEVKYVSSTAAPASWEAESSSSGSSSYSSGSSGSSYSFVSSTAAPIVYTTPAPVVKIVESAAPISYSSSSSSSSSSSNSGYSSQQNSGSYSFVSSTASPIAYTTGHSVKVVESAPTGYEATGLSTGYDYSSNQEGSSGSSYSSFSSGSGAQSSGFESYVDLGNSGYSGFSSGLGVINVGSSDYSSTAAPVIKSSSYVSTTPHSVVSSTIGSLGGDISVRNSGSSGYSQRSSGRSRGTKASTTKKPCRRCASSTSAPLAVHENTYVSNVY